MEDLANYPRLMKRGGTYYHRASIPPDIRDTYPKTEETFSLQTKDFHEAVRRLRVESARVDDLFEAHRRRRASESVTDLSSETVSQLADLYYRHLLEEDDEWRLARAQEIYAGYVPDDADFDEQTEWVDVLADVERKSWARGRVSEHITFEVEDLLNWDGVRINLKRGSIGWLRLARAIQAATIRAHEAVRARQDGQLIETPKGDAKSLSVDPVAPRSDSPLLSEVVEIWLVDKSRAAWTEKTAHAHRRCLETFIELVGDRPLLDYSKADGRSFKEMLLTLPANRDKVASLSGLSVRDAMAKAKELGLSAMSASTAEHQLRYIGGFWSWVEGHYDEHEAPRSPFRGIKVEVDKRRSARDERDPFPPEALQRIFGSPLYTGCHSLKSCTKPGSLIPTDSGRYWVPLIALYSGARAGEIIQLTPDDIGSEAGVAFFNITEDGEERQGRGVKTASSNRRIPIHPKLIELGLLDLVERRRRDGVSRLFPELVKGSDGYYSSAWSKFFNGPGRFLDKLGVYRPGLSFHSFRHNFEDACREAGVPKEVMNALQGHAEEGMAARYGSGYSVTVLFEAVRRINYKGLLDT